MIPVYGFLEEDTLGLLIFADESDTAEMLVTKVKSAAKVRVPLREGGQLIFNGEHIEPKQKISGIGLTALDRVDVRWERQ